MPDFVVTAGGRPEVELVFDEGGTEEGRVVVSPLLPERISPLAALSLFVKDEMAQPAHPDVSFAGEDMRGAPVPAVREGDGRTESGIDWVYLRIRVR